LNYPSDNDNSAYIAVNEIDSSAFVFSLPSMYVVAQGGMDHFDREKRKIVLLEESQDNEMNE
jgi:hypothetical protein